MHRIPCLVVAALALGLACGLTAAGQPPGKPMTAYAWTPNEAGLDNIVPFYWLRINELDPERAKAATDRMPPGHRAIFAWDLDRDFHQHPDDRCRDAAGRLTQHESLWWDNAVKRSLERYDGFFRKYKAIGGQLDVFVLDYEHGMTNWHIGDNGPRWLAIAADPRFKVIARQLGFDDIATVWKWNKTDNHYLVWNALMQERMAAYLNQGIYEPVRRHYPNVRFSNYGYSYYNKGLGFPEENGHDSHLYGRGAHVGTHQAPSLYGSLGQIESRSLDGKNPYAKTPFNAFRYHANAMRCAVGASRVPIMPWISHKRFETSLLRDGDLYQELVLHVCLCGPDAILYWNPGMWTKNQDPDHFRDEVQDTLFSDCLKQFDELAPGADRKTLSATALIPWGDDYALTGMAAGGKSVWRFTPKLEGGAGRESVLVAKSPATFKVGTTTVTIPGGTVYEPKKEVSKQGYWVVAPLGAKPTVEPSR
jgi:hypothetical protein